MRPVVTNLLALPALMVMAEVPANTSGAPVLAGHAALSAAPEALAQGESGPINRVAFDLLNVEPDESPKVSCLYSGGLAYRCRATVAKAVPASRAARVIVEIPDLDHGSTVRVRFAVKAGQIEAPFRIVNHPRVVREIESLSLPNGGQIVTDGNGRPAASSQFSTERARTLPTVVRTMAGEPACGEIYPRWVSANATEPVFTSTFGAMNGTVVLSRAPDAGSIVDAKTGPEWLITHPLGATRVQFIAHYEIEYRVGICDELRLAS